MAEGDYFEQALYLIAKLLSMMWEMLKRRRQDRQNTRVDVHVFTSNRENVFDIKLNGPRGNISVRVVLEEKEIKDMQFTLVNEENGVVFTADREHYYLDDSKVGYALKVDAHSAEAEPMVLGFEKILEPKLALLVEGKLGEEEKEELYDALMDEFDLSLMAGYLYLNAFQMRRRLLLNKGDV